MPDGGGSSSLCFWRADRGTLYLHSWHTDVRCHAIYAEIHRHRRHNAPTEKNHAHRMVENAYHVVFPLFAKTINGYTSYVKYIHNNWVVTLLVAAVLQLYSTHRISSELQKNKQREA